MTFAPSYLITYMLETARPPRRDWLCASGGVSHKTGQSQIEVSWCGSVLCWETEYTCSTTQFDFCMHVKNELSNNPYITITGKIFL